MAKADRNRFARIFHTIVAILILLFGAAFLSLGIWLTTTKKGDELLNLNFPDEYNSFKVFLHFDIVSIISGCFLLLTGLFSLLALAKGEGTKCISITFRIWYIIFALVILSVLLVLFVLCIFILIRKDDRDIRDYVQTAWSRTVKDNPLIICSIEGRFKCRGFETGSCKKALSNNVTSLCAPCRSDDSIVVISGCYNRILQRIDNMFIPMAIVSGLFGILILIDIFLTCVL